MLGFDPFTSPVEGPAPSPAVPLFSFHAFGSDGGWWSGTADAAMFVVTDDGTPTHAVQDGAPGFAHFVTDTTNANQVLVRTNNEVVSFVSGTMHRIYGKFALRDISNTEFAFGFADGDVTDPLDDGTADGAWFYTSAGDGGIDCRLGNATLETTNQETGITLADDTIVELGIEVLCRKYESASGVLRTVKFFVNGVEKKQFSAKLPTDGMMIFFQHETITGSAAETLRVYQLAIASYKP